MKQLIPTIILLMISGYSISQTAFFKQSSLVELEENSNKNDFIKSFDLIEAEGKIYLKWLVNGEKQDCVFQIQRSKDGVNYKTIAYKQGVGTDVSIDLLYCYTDEKPDSRTVYYRIARCLDCGKLLYSDYAMISMELSNTELPVFAKDGR
jgi:hypothetical protein